MIRFLVALIVFTIATTCYSQSGYPKYYAFYELWKKGDSCMTQKSFMEAGNYFYKAANAEIEIGIDTPRDGIRYSAACAYTLAGKKKKALKILNELAFQYHFKDVDTILTDSTYASLHNRKAWKVITDKIALNHQVWLKEENKYTNRTHYENHSDEIIFYPHRSDFTRNILNQDTLPFLSISHEHFRVYFSANSYAANHIDEIKKQISFAFSNALQILNIKKYNRGIQLILFDSVEEMKSATGVRALGGIAYPVFDAALFPITAQRRPQFKHEIFHIISQNILGTSNCRLLTEGSAVYADNECHYENPIPTINAFYLKSNQLVSLDSLINHFDEIAFKNDVLAYLQSAGIFKYLFENYGLEKIKLLWISGFADFKSIYGFPIEEFEKEWINFIKTINIPKDFDIRKLSEGCG